MATRSATRSATCSGTFFSGSSECVPDGYSNAFRDKITRQKMEILLKKNGLWVEPYSGGMIVNHWKFLPIICAERGIEVTMICVESIAEFQDCGAFCGIASARGRGYPHCVGISKVDDVFVVHTFGQQFRTDNEKQMALLNVRGILGCKKTSRVSPTAKNILVRANGLVAMMPRSHRGEPGWSPGWRCEKQGFGIFCVRVVLAIFAYVKILRKYCENIAKILRKYCENIVVLFKMLSDLLKIVEGTCLSVTGARDLYPNRRDKSIFVWQLENISILSPTVNWNGVNVGGAWTQIKKGPSEQRIRKDLGATSDQQIWVIGVQKKWNDLYKSRKKTAEIRYHEPSEKFESSAMICISELKTWEISATATLKEIRCLPPAQVNPF